MTLQQFLLYCPIVSYQVSHNSEKYPQKKGKKKELMEEGRKTSERRSQKLLSDVGFTRVISCLRPGTAQCSWWGDWYMLRAKVVFQSNSHFHLLFVMPGHSEIVRHWVNAQFSEKNIHSSNLRFNDLKDFIAPAPLVIPDAEETKLLTVDTDLFHWRFVFVLNDLQALESVKCTSPTRRCL